MSVSSLRAWLRDVVFEAETRAGKWFDITLLIVIALSVLAVMLESVKSISTQYREALVIAEWVFTVIFSLEYILRLLLVERPRKYALSFYGIVDLLSCLPSYLAVVIPGAQSLLVIRILRMLRMFRVMKMVNHVEGGDVIMRALYNSRAKIMVFFFTVAVFAVIAGTIMYLVEGHVNTEYSSIPQSIYWAIVTISTVGYGDISPVTSFGKIVATFTMLSTYAIIAVPTGIVTAELSRRRDHTTNACPGCGVHGHLEDAKYCRKCGTKLD